MTEGKDTEIAATRIEAPLTFWGALDKLLHSIKAAIVISIISLFIIAVVKPEWISFLKWYDISAVIFALLFGKMIADWIPVPGKYLLNLTNLKDNFVSVEFIPSLLFKEEYEVRGGNHEYATYDNPLIVVNDIEENTNEKTHVLITSWLSGLDELNFFKHSNTYIDMQKKLYELLNDYIDSDVKTKLTSLYETRNNINDFLNELDSKMFSEEESNGESAAHVEDTQPGQE